MMLQMDFKKERQRLDAIKNVNFRRYSEELKKPWPGMAEDINLLLVILEQEQESGHGKPPKLIYGYQILGDQVSTSMSNWLSSAVEEFRSEFGIMEG